MLEKENKARKEDKSPGVRMEGMPFENRVVQKEFTEYMTYG